MKSSTLITESNNLLKEYSDLANLKVDTSARDKLLTTLAKEEVAIEKAIKAGRRVAQAEINALLGLADEESMEDSKQGSDVLKLGAQEAQAKARTRGETAESRKTESWAVVAAESVKAFGKMTKVVGGDEMEE